MILKFNDVSVERFNKLCAFIPSPLNHLYPEHKTESQTVAVRFISIKPRTTHNAEHTSCENIRYDIALDIQDKRQGSKEAHVNARTEPVDVKYLVAVYEILNQ